MKRAFSLLELVLAIVVIAVAVSSIPGLIFTSAKSNQQMLLQEVVSATKARLVTQTYDSFQTPEQSNIPAKTENSYISNPRTAYYTANGSLDLPTLHNEDIAGTSAATDKNILNVTYNLSQSGFGIKKEGGTINNCNSNINTTTTGASVTNYPQECDEITYIITSEYTDENSETQKVVMRSYVFNIGTPQYGTIVVK